MPNAKWNVAVVTISMILMNSSLYAMDQGGKGLYPLLNVAGEEEQSLLPQPPYYQVTPQYFPGAVYPTDPPPPYEPKTITAKEHKTTIQRLKAELEEKRENLRRLPNIHKVEKKDVIGTSERTLAKFAAIATLYWISRSGVSLIEGSYLDTQSENSQLPAPFRAPFVYDFITVAIYTCITGCLN